MDLCYDDTRSIKILLAPVGLNSCFESQFLLVSNFRELDLNDLTRPSSWNAPQNFRYSHMDRGSLIFDYLRPDDIQSRGYDKLKAVIMVIGLLNFPDFVQNNLAYGDAIANFFKDFGSVPVCRLLIFNHNFETAVLSLSNFPTIHQSDPDLIVTMPPNSTTVRFTHYCNSFSISFLFTIYFYSLICIFKLSCLWPAFV